MPYCFGGRLRFWWRAWSAWRVALPGLVRRVSTALLRVRGGDGVPCYGGLVVSRVLVSSGKAGQCVSQVVFLTRHGDLLRLRGGMESGQIALV